MNVIYVKCLLGLQTHIRVHTEMRSFRIRHAIDKYYTNRMEPMQRIDKKLHKKRKAKVMPAKPPAELFDIVIDLTED